MKNKIIRLFVVIIFSVGFIIVLFQNQHETAKIQIAEQMVESQALLAETGAKQIRQIFDMAADELISAAQSFPMQNLLAAIAKNDIKQIDLWRDILSHFFITATEPHRFISQLRLIDSRGMEVVRVDRKDDNIYPVAKLQDKSKEFYFSKAMGMNFGRFYLSPITLNREFGKIEIPHREMVRLATPVKYNNQKKGILVMNIEMKSIYNIIDNLSDHAWLFDSFGKVLNCSIGLPQKDHKMMIDLISRQDSGAFHLPMDHYHKSEETSLVGFYPVKIFANKWYVVSERPIDEILDIMLRGNRLKIISSGIIMIALIWLFIDLFKLYTGQQKDHLKALMADKLLHLNKQLILKSTDLKKANNSLKEIDKKKTEFLNLVAHDLRTPLSSILNYSELLLRYGNNSDRACRDEYAGIIIKESVRLKNLVTSYLDVSKIEAGLMGPNHEEFHIKELIDHFVMLYQGEGISNQITLTHEMENDLPHVKCDKEKIGQVFSNLLSNAIKFTPPNGHINVKASFVKINENDFISPFVQVSITDTGIGIPEDAVDRIFDKFYQANHKDVKPVCGTGLGLAISKAIIEQHGGNIEVESKEGQGTKFTFTVQVSERATEKTSAAL